MAWRTTNPERPYWYELPVTDSEVGNTYYVKCYSAGSGGTPPNSRRMQLASQYGTIDYDPTLPRINNTDTKSCMRMRNSMTNLNELK